VAGSVPASSSRRRKAHGSANGQDHSSLGLDQRSTTDGLDKKSGLCQSSGRGRWTKPIGARLEPAGAPAPSGGEMKARIMVTALLAVALSLAASTASGSVKVAKADSITVWLMGDAQSGWPNVVAEANAAFKAKHPGVDVKVQYQTWGDHLTKFDATIAGGDTPDVLEFGNSETTKYMANGALKQLKASSFPNSKTW